MEFGWPPGTNASQGEKQREGLQWKEGGQRVPCFRRRRHRKGAGYCGELLPLHDSALCWAAGSEVGLQKCFVMEGRRSGKPGGYMTQLGQGGG